MSLNVLNKRTKKDKKDHAAGKIAKCPLSFLLLDPPQCRSPTLVLFYRAFAKGQHTYATWAIWAQVASSMRLEKINSTMELQPLLSFARFSPVSIFNQVSGSKVLVPASAAAAVVCLQLDTRKIERTLE